MLNDIVKVSKGVVHAVEGSSSKLTSIDVRVAMNDYVPKQKILAKIRRVLKGIE